MSQAAPVSDLQLQALAAEPRSDLFYILKLGPLFSPWLAVLAFLPGIAGVLNWTIADQSAAWGLRAMVWQSGAEEPVLTNLAPLQGAPPLSTWLTMGGMSLVGLRPPVSLMLVSYLAVAVTVLFAAKLGRRFGSARLGFLTALLCAVHPLLLNGAHTCGPEALGLCFLTISFERFLAHLDGSPSIWSGRLLVSALAWGAAWLSIGWQAFALGFAFIMVSFIIPFRFPAFDAANPVIVTQYAGRKRLRHSVLIWFAIGIVSGGWWIAGQAYQHGLSATWQWIQQSAPNAISPLYPQAELIRRQGVMIGHAFLTGWACLGLISLIRHREQLLPPFPDRRSIMIIIFGMRLLVWRIMLSTDNEDPTPCDLLLTLPFCLLSALGMEALMRRICRPADLAIAILVGLVNIVQTIPYLQDQAALTLVGVGAAVCLLPLLMNFVQSRTWRWSEFQRRRALRGLILGTWLCHGGWGILQSRSTSPGERGLAVQLGNSFRTLPHPDALLLISQTPPPATLEFQLRARWPQTQILAADRWETALALGGSLLPPERSAGFLAIELNRRGMPIHLPEPGWAVTSGGEPFRYRGFQVTSYHVKQKGWR
jgi:hypothetical protein